MSAKASSDDFEKMFFECRRQQGQITALMVETGQLSQDLSTEQRARSRAVSNVSAIFLGVGTLLTCAGLLACGTMPKGKRIGSASTASCSLATE
jgi:hypothetical protein